VSIEFKHSTNATPLKVRPYQLLCAICSLGGPLPKDGRVEKVDHLKAAIRENPDVPLTLVCNAGDLFAYQDPGPAEDTPEGADYNRKRDLDILQRMNWPPGITLPARVIFLSLFPVRRRPLPIPTTDGICGYGETSVPGWKGCPKARSGDYEKGLQLGSAALMPPRAEAEMAREKASSLEAMYAAGEVRLRPHLLLCAVCQYAAGERPPFKPDDLPEFLQMILKDKPDIPVRLVRQADWMMCGPCPQRVPGLNGCANIQGAGGLSNEKRDLDVLQQLGLHYGDVIKARDLYRLIFAKIRTSLTTCARNGNGPTSVWWDRGCGDPNPETRHKLYETGREELKDKFQ
jgi:hypothetical protein